METYPKRIFDRYVESKFIHNATVHDFVSIVGLHNVIRDPKRYIIHLNGARVRALEPIQIGDVITIYDTEDRYIP